MSTYIPAVDAWGEAVWFDPDGGTFWAKPDAELPDGYRRLYVEQAPTGPVRITDVVDQFGDQLRSLEAPLRARITKECIAAGHDPLAWERIFADATREVTR